MSDGEVSLLYRLLGRDEASPAFNKAGKSAEGLHTHMISVGTAIGSLAAGGIMALGGLAVNAAKTGIETAAAMQQAQLGFATLLGSEKAAGDYMKWLTGFAASTPFEMKGLVESARTLIGVGVSAEKTKGMLQDFGDASSAIGIEQDAFQRIMLATSQAISAGKFQAGDLNQIMTNGLPVWSILSKAMHKTVPELRDMASHGQLLAKDVLPALQGEMHKDYGGAMTKQSQTLNGLWSTFQDTISLGLAKAFKPLIPILQKILPGAMDLLGKGFTAVADFITAAIPKVQTFANEAGPKLSPILNVLSTIIGSVVGWVRDSLIPALQHAAEQIFPAVRNAIATVSAAFRDHQGMVNLVVAIFKILGSFITTILIPVLTQLVSAVLASLGPAFRLIGTLVDTIVIPAFKYMMEVWMSVAGHIIDSAAWAFGWIPGLGSKLKSAQEAFHKFSDDVNAALAGITKTTTANVYVNVHQQTIAIPTGPGTGGIAKPRAAGGPVRQGELYLVGENGPELFVPGASGAITPNGGGGSRASGGGTHIHLHVSSGFIGSYDQLATALSDIVARARARGVPIAGIG